MTRREGPHTLPIRVYYEDTDCGGVVYYANYLRYFERGRTEYLRERGIDVADFAAKGTLFVVVHAEIDYRASARYNDLLTIETWISRHTRTTFTFSHVIRHSESGKALVEGEATLACLGSRGKPARLPDAVAAVAREAASSAP